MQVRHLATWVFSAMLITSNATEIRTPIYSSPPKYFTENGSVKGLCIDVIHAIEKLEPSVKFVGWNEEVPLPRIEAGMSLGNYDLMLCMVKEPERTAKFTVIDIPVYKVDDVLIARTEDQANIKTIEDVVKLANDNVILVRAGTTHEKFLAKLPNVAMDSGGYSLEQQFAKLEAKRGRFIFTNESVAARHIKQNHLESKFKILPAPIRTTGRYFMFSKAVDPAVVRKVAAALEKLANSGELKKIAAQYAIE